MVLHTLHSMAAITGDLAKGLTGSLGCLASALSIAMIGTKAVESVGRNPGAAGRILVQSILGMALAEAIAFYALFLS